MTSALPMGEVLARLPCLATRAPPRRGHERDGRGDVKGAQAVAAGADDIEDFVRADFGIERRLN